MSREPSAVTPPVMIYGRSYTPHPNGRWYDDEGGSFTQWQVESYAREQRGASVRPPAEPMRPPRCATCGVVGGMAVNACGHTSGKPSQVDALPDLCASVGIECETR